MSFMHALRRIYRAGREAVVLSFLGGFFADSRWPDDLE
jgi:hypothetical protein